MQSNKNDSKLSIVSAYFSIDDFDPLRTELSDIQQLGLLCAEPRFIAQIDPTKTETKAFDIKWRSVVGRGALLNESENRHPTSYWCVKATLTDINQSDG